MTIYQTLMNEIKQNSVRGVYAQPVPVGLQVTLNYSDKGILTKVVYENGKDVVDIPFDVVVKLMSAKVIIQRLDMYKAACQVFGVLVAPPSSYKFTKTTGKLPECFYERLIKTAKSNPDLFKFYALDLKATGSQYLASVAAHNRLSMMKFDVIPGIAIGASTNFKSIEVQFNKTIAAIIPELPILSGIYLHDRAIQLVSADLRCIVINKFEPVLDVNGYVHGKMNCNLSNIGEAEIVVPYSQVVKYQISSGCFAIIDIDNNIQYVSQPKMFSRVASPTITCPICGKKYTVPVNSRTVSCEDIHCPSKLYPQICRMISKLGLAEMLQDQFTEYVKEGKIKKLQDVLNLPENSRADVTTTLSNLIEAITPISLVAGDMDAVAKFVHQSASNTAVSYYVHNPEKLTSDLKVSKQFGQRFKEFFSDPYNVETYDAFIELPEISVVNPKKKFDGDLIFRNKLICLTGDFKHGSYDDIISIMGSYAGTCAVEFTPQVSFVLVGHFGTPDPYIIERAQAYNKPIYAELEFFRAYQIDKDLDRFHLI